MVSRSELGVIKLRSSQVARRHVISEVGTRSEASRVADLSFFLLHLHKELILSTRNKLPSSII
jgi:hypothetical protein